MIADIDNVVEWLKLNNLEYWTVQSGNGDNKRVFESDEDAKFEDNISRFQDVMKICSGKYYISARNKKMNGRSGFNETFNNFVAPSAVSGIMQPSPVSGFIAANELDRRLDEQRKSIFHEFELKRLQDENKELKEELTEKDNAITRAITTIEPYIGSILGGIAAKFTPQPVAVGIAGVTPADGHTANLPDETRLEQALQRWNAVEPQMLQIIETLASMAERNDNMYITAKGFLIK